MVYHTRYLDPDPRETGEAVAKQVETTSETDKQEKKDLQTAVVVQNTEKKLENLKEFVGGNAYEFLKNNNTQLYQSMKSHYIKNPDRTVRDRYANIINTMSEDKVQDYIADICMREFCKNMSDMRQNWVEIRMSPALVAKLTIVNKDGRRPIDGMINGIICSFTAELFGQKESSRGPIDLTQILASMGKPGDISEKTGIGGILQSMTQMMGKMSSCKEFFKRIEQVGNVIKDLSPKLEKEGEPLPTTLTTADGFYTMFNDKYNAYFLGGKTITATTEPKDVFTFSKNATFQETLAAGVSNKKLDEGMFKQFLPLGNQLIQMTSIAGPKIKEFAGNVTEIYGQYMEVIETIFGADNVESFIKDNKFGLDAVFGTVLGYKGGFEGFRNKADDKKITETFGPMAGSIAQGIKNALSYNENHGSSYKPHQSILSVVKFGSEPLNGFIDIQKQVTNMQQFVNSYNKDEDHKNTHISETTVKMIESVDINNLSDNISIVLQGLSFGNSEEDKKTLSLVKNLLADNVTGEVGEYLNNIDKEGGVARIHMWFDLMKDTEKIKKLSYQLACNLATRSITTDKLPNGSKIFAIQQSCPTPESYNQHLLQSMFLPDNIPGDKMNKSFTRMTASKVSTNNKDVVGPYLKQLEDNKNAEQQKGKESHKNDEALDAAESANTPETKAPTEPTTPLDPKQPTETPRDDNNIPLLPKPSISDNVDKTTGSQKEQVSKSMEAIGTNIPREVMIQLLHQQGPVGGPAILYAVKHNVSISDALEATYNKGKSPKDQVAEGSILGNMKNNVPNDMRNKLTTKQFLTHIQNKYIERYYQANLDPKYISKSKQDAVNAITNTCPQFGIKIEVAKATANMESELGTGPDNKTYRGLFQLSGEERETEQADKKLGVGNYMTSFGDKIQNTMVWSKLYIKHRNQVYNKKYTEEYASVLQSLD